MSTLTDNLERLTVTVASPDGNLKATADSERLTRFRLRPDIRLDAYDAASLARQVTAVLTALSDGRRRAIEQIRGEPAPNQPHWDAKRRRFYAALSEATVDARSGRGAIQLRARDRLSTFQVKIHPQALSRLDAEGFLAELHSGYAKLLLADRLERIRLRREHRLQ